MDQNWRNEGSPNNEHLGYSGSDFSPSTNPSGGLGRFRGNNYGGSGGGSYYGAGYDTTPYAGGDTESVSGLGRSSYNEGALGTQGGGHMENTYGSADRSSSYGGGRIEQGYGRGERWSNRYGEYGTTGGESGYDPYSEYERDQRSRFGGRNEEGSRRGTSGNFSGPGRGWEGRRHSHQDIHDVTDYGFRNRQNEPYRGAGSFSGMDTGHYSGGNYGGTGSYGGGMSHYGYGNLQGSDRSAGPGHSGSDFYSSGRIDWDYSRGDYGVSGASGSYMGGSSRGSGDRSHNEYRGVHGGSGRSNSPERSYSRGATYGGGLSDNYRSPGEGGGYYGHEGRSTRESDFGGGSYGQGRSSHATGGNTSRGDMPGGSTAPFTDPWL